MSSLNQFLKMAVLAGVEQAVQIHIDRGDDLNARDSNGLTLLMLSAAKNKPAMCRLLLLSGADGSLLDPTGRTAHAIAIAAGSQQAAEVLATLAMAESAQTLVPIPSGDDPQAASIWHIKNALWETHERASLRFVIR